MAEEAEPFVVRGRGGWVVFEGAVDEGGEVVGFVEVFEHAGGGFQVVVDELDAAAGGGGGELGDVVGEEGGAGEEVLVGVEDV